MCKPILILLIFISNTLFAKESENKNLVKVLIRPECKEMFYGPDFFNEHKKRPDYVFWDSTRAHPLAFIDPRTSITFYVESDGRHLSAINEKAILLWLHNPFEEAGECEYRSPHPVITKMEIFENTEALNSSLRTHPLNLKHKFISIEFDSSQFGIIDEATGEYFPLGQN